LVSPSIFCTGDPVTANPDCSQSIGMIIHKGMWQCSILRSLGIYLERLRKYTREVKIRIQSEILGVMG
jgi:hypothetical protein